MPSWLTHEIIEKTLNQPNFNLIDMESHIIDICILPNDTLIVIKFCNFNHNLCIYDKNFKLIKVNEEIDNKKLRWFALATDNIQRVYITGSGSNIIIMTDLELNKRKLINLKIDKFNDTIIYGVCYKDNFIYTSDYKHKRIIKLTSELEYVENFTVDYKPIRIYSIKDTICVRDGGKYELYFHDRITFQLKYKFCHGIGVISGINSWFYEITGISQNLYVYDASGELIKTIELSYLQDYIKSPWCGCMAYFHECLLLTCEQGSKIITFNLSK